MPTNLPKNPGIASLNTKLQSLYTHARPVVSFTADFKCHSIKLSVHQRSSKKLLT